MRHNREFEIAWQGLKPGLHTFLYEVGDRFLEEHGEADRDYKDLSAKVKLDFDKKSGFFLLHFDIDGQLTVPCDRCGEDFQIKLWDEFDLVIKLAGEDAEDVDEDADVIFIPRHETVIDVSKWVYEFLVLSIPLQRVHPDLPDGSRGCNAEALRLLDRLSGPAEETEIKNGIWKGLNVPDKDDKNKYKSNKS